MSAGDFYDSYGDGSTVSGDFIADDVTIGDVTVPYQIFGSASSSTGTVQNGILGLGFTALEGIAITDGTPYSDLLDSLTSSGLIAGKYFSLYLDDLGEF